MTFTSKPASARLVFALKGSVFWVPKRKLDTNIWTHHVPKGVAQSTRPSNTAGSCDNNCTCFHWVRTQIQYAVFSTFAGHHTLSTLLVRVLGSPRRRKGQRSQWPFSGSRLRTTTKTPICISFLRVNVCHCVPSLYFYRVESLWTNIHWQCLQLIRINCCKMSRWFSEFLLLGRARRSRDGLWPHSHRTRNASKWDLLLSMGVFTLHASNIKGFAFRFACGSHPTSCVN